MSKNIRSARGGVVHQAASYGLPICGALNRAGVPYVTTELPVSCKRCAKYNEPQPDGRTLRVGDYYETDDGVLHEVVAVDGQRFRSGKTYRWLDF